MENRNAEELTGTVIPEPVKQGDGCIEFYLEAEPERTLVWCRSLSGCRIERYPEARAKVRLQGRYGSDMFTQVAQGVTRPGGLPGEPSRFVFVKLELVKMRLTYLICAATLFSGCGNPRQPSEPATFDFHSGVGGQVIWRCNRQTGEVYFCDYRRRSKLNPNARAPQWRKVLEPAEIETPPVADELSLGAPLNLPGAMPDIFDQVAARQRQTVETPYAVLEFPADMAAAEVRAETERFVREHSQGGPLELSNTAPRSRPPRQVPR